MKYIFVLISFVFTFLLAKLNQKQAMKMCYWSIEILLSILELIFSIRQWFMDQKNDIPAEESAWGIGNLVVDEINEKLKKSAKMLKIKKFQKEIHFD